MELRDEFELLRGSYRQQEAGRHLIECFSSDWKLFPDMDASAAASFLGEVFGAEVGALKFESIAPPGPTGEALSRWERLSEELRHENRFFPREVFGLEHLGGLFIHLALESADLPENWFRARIQGPDGPYVSEEMLAPPKKVASHGRANPAGIPYLYLASNLATAASEVRPHTGERVSVANFSLHDELSVVDLVEPRVTASPFAIADEESIAALCADIEFLEKLGSELSRPVVPGSAAIDYVPSQYLSELIKSSGFHGVRYSSAVGDGVNLALFDPDNATVGEVREHKVSRMHVDVEPL